MPAKELDAKVSERSANEAPSAVAMAQARDAASTTLTARPGTDALDRPLAPPILTRRPQLITPNPLLRLAGPALLALAKMRVAQWNRRARDPRSVQIATLEAHCRRAAATAFGRAHDLASVRDERDFRARVPLRTYADFEPWFLRMRGGERDVLWPGLIAHFALSSGTSRTAAGEKYLPISTEQVRWQQRSGFDLVARYVASTRDFAFCSRFSLMLWPPGVVSREGAVNVSSNPGLMSLHLPAVARHFCLPGPSVRDIEDCEEKLTALAETHLDYDVGSLSGTTCWVPLVFDRLLQAARRRGRRASTVKDLWPHLRVLFGGGVAAQPYRAPIELRLGRPLVLIDNYNATEGGILAATAEPGDDALLVLPDRGVFYEFIPVRELGRAYARRHALWEVEKGIEYAVAVTTSSGLFAYLLGDWVRFESTFPHRLTFVGRTNGVLSLTQELTTASEVERAVMTAGKSHSASLVEFAASTETFAGLSNTLGRYVVFAEFDKPPTNLPAFARAIDESLAEQNRVYRAHRAKDVAIAPLKVVELKRGTTARLVRALGHSSVQQKFPRLLDASQEAILRQLHAESGG